MAQFTSASATAPFGECQRCHGWFARARLSYITGIAGTGRLACPACTAHYQAKNGEGVASPLHLAPSSAGGPGLAVIGAEFTEPASHFPLHDPNERKLLERASAASQRGEVSLPQQVFGTIAHPTPSSTPTHGYTSNHQLHAQHRAKMVAATTVQQRQVTISIALKHTKEEGRSGAELVGNIECEIYVPLSITLSQLRTMTIANLQPMWAEWSYSHPLRLESLRMYKHPRLLLYDPANPGAENDRLVLHEFFFRPSGKDPTPKFNGNVKMMVILLMSFSQFQGVLAAKVRGEAAHTQLNTGSAPLSIRRQRARGQSTASDASTSIAGPLKRQRATGEPSLFDDEELEYESEDQESAPVPSRSRNHSTSTCNNPPPPASSTSILRSHDLLSPAAHSNSPAQGSSSTSRGNAAPQSTSSLSTPPASTPAARSGSSSGRPQFVPPDKTALERAIAEQGELRNLTNPLLDHDIALHYLYYVPSVSFDILLQGALPFNVEDKANCDVGQLTVNCSSRDMIGRPGSFKTCHPCTLHVVSQPKTLSSSSSSSSTPKSETESILSDPVIVAKRIFFRQAPDGFPAGRRRYAVRDELSKMLIEADCLYWATTLMNMLYEFIDDSLVRLPRQRPQPPQIPRLRIVHAALAVPKLGATQGAVYLLEEKIYGSFVKYINNNSTCPGEFLRGEQLAIAEFLCFAQHAQYYLTQGLVFISDFQGAGDLLTDCQIITSLKYKDKFGEGNWTPILDEFPRLHTCNQYCAFFRLPVFLPYTVEDGEIRESRPQLSTGSAND